MSYSSLPFGQQNHPDNLAAFLLLGIKKLFDVIKHNKCHQNEYKSYCSEQVLSLLYRKLLCFVVFCM